MMSLLRWGVVLLLVATSCSGVSQEEHDQLQELYDAARDQLAAVDVDQAQLAATETAVAAYLAAMDPIDVDALRDVYAPDLVFFDAARGITFRSRDTALADLGSGVAAYRMESQVVRGTTVAPGKAVIEWEIQGTTEIDTDWSFRAVSVLNIESGLVAGETFYYDHADAPWG